jgi:hypothetical protein
VVTKRVEKSLEDFLNELEDVELDGVEVRVVKLQPSEAENLLQRNTHNRPLRPLQVEEFVELMKAGLYRFNGDAVRLNADGSLDDGQHRLTACARSGVPLVTVLVTGLGTEVHNTLDKGMKRDLATDLLWEQEDRPRVLAAAIKLGASLESPDPARINPTRKYVTDSACLSWFRGNRELTRHIGKGVQISKRVKGRPEIWAVLSYVTWKANEKKSVEFIDKMITGIGMSSEDDPTLIFRTWVYNTYEKARTQQSYVKRHVLLGTGIKAWNAYVEERTLVQGRMIYKPFKGEKWPTILG